MSKPDLKQKVYDYLAKEIGTGALLPNTPIVEQDISEKLNVSRTPVREALKQLEQEGLVTHFSSRGTYVKELTAEDINEIYQLRVLFELAALEKGMMEISREELDELETLIRAIRDDSTDEEFYLSDRALHTTILRHARNMRMIKFYNILDAQIERIRRMSSASPKRLLASRSEHLGIVEAIRAKDHPLASQRLSEHMDNVRKSALKAYQAMRMGLKY